VILKLKQTWFSHAIHVVLICIMVNICNILLFKHPSRGSRVMKTTLFVMDRRTDGRTTSAKTIYLLYIYWWET